MAKKKSKPVSEAATDAIRLRHAKIVERVERDRPRLDARARRKMADLEPLRDAMAQLKRHRRRQHVTLAQLAHRTGIDKGNLSKLENARYPNATIHTLHRIAAGLGVRLRLIVEAA